MIEPIRFNVKDLALGFLSGATLVMITVFYKLGVI